MAVKFFGQFLAEKGVISGEDILKAIALQESVNLKFGEMALSMGLINESDIKRVQEAQRSEDLRFGDMCEKLGIMTGKEIDQVITKQKNSHLYIGEALVKVGAIQREDLQGYLDSFKEDQAPYVIEKVTIPCNTPYGELIEVSVDLTYKMVTRIVGLTFKPGQCEVVDRIDHSDTVASIGLSGDISACYLFAVSSSIRELIAKAILEEKDVANEPDEVMDDTVMEFANIVCGNIAAKAAQLGKKIEIAPPEVLNIAAEGNELPEDGKGLLFPIYLLGGHMALCMVIKEI